MTFLFKGGTSLSRVFGIVDRFSEDIDLLAVFPDGAATNARHKLLKQVDSDVIAHLGLTKNDVTVGASTTGVKRYTTYHYPVEEYDEGLKEGVLLELGSRGGTYPAGPHRYRSMLADYAITELGEPEDAWEEFATFEVEVLSPERTLLEKMAAVHDAAVRNDTETLRQHGRHFYDIDRLLTTPSVIEALSALGDGGFAELVKDINVHSEEAGFSWSARPEDGYADSPAFDPAHPSHASILTGYESAQCLIHGVHVSFEQVLSTHFGTPHQPVVHPATQQARPSHLLLEHSMSRSRRIRCNDPAADAAEPQQALRGLAACDASWPGGMWKASPGRASPSVPSSIRTPMRPFST
ncbi:MAG: nucleotidyl transferase AbiEii/AbiGii toxin family protein [Nocardioidaceae bacterium]